jgi:hypothetical protein
MAKEPLSYFYYQRHPNLIRGEKMGSIAIRKDEDILKIRNRIQRKFKSVKAFRAKQYIGKLKLKEDPLSYQKRVRKEWNEYTD